MFAEEFTSGLGRFHDASTWWRPLGLDSENRASMANVAGGMLSLDVNRQSTPSGLTYVGGVVDTRDTFSRAGGYIEARVRYPAGTGFWPAFWLYGDALGANEIDILEGYPSPNGWPGVTRYEATLHYEGGKQGFTLDPSSTASLVDTFHTYAVDWRPGQRLDFYFDGVLQASITANVPTGTMYPILNMAVGSWAGRADATTPSTGRMDVDYVRWWSAKP